MKKIVIAFSIILIACLSSLAQSPPTLRIVTETPGLPSELFYGNVKVKPVRLRPGTNQVITIDDIDFLVQQQYIDFLGRFPDQTGFQNWVNTVTGCPNGGFGENDNPSCDRVHMSAGFVQSYEFQGRGYWLLRFGYVGLNRSITDTTTGRTQRSSLTYAEFIPGLQQIGGPNSPAQEEAAKIVYMNNFVQRSDFLALFPNSDPNATYVNKLEANAGVTLTPSFKQAQVDGLNNATLTRAQVLRNIAESNEVFNKYILISFVDMEYKGYLRRDPDTIGYNNWIDTLNANPNDYRHMVFGFIYSSEYRSRF
ncbi:MAG TPA: DUF4214 domain-containing protein [Pyrinomonadaceae bacterium]|nr:DUF4214 domain-containing protein [Pyrinomonadaceae bacterium]